MNEHSNEQNDSTKAPFRGLGGKEAIILAGGLGTRLRDTVPGLPKCMATVAGRPFLFHVINYLRGQGIEHFIFSLGHLHEMIEAYLQDQFSTLSYQCVIEQEPLGTGGAIQLALKQVKGSDAVIANGDTLYKADLREAAQFHVHNNAACTLLLKPMQHFDRYGVVELAEDGLVQQFKEKQFYPEGNINGGLYILNAGTFREEQFPAKFSFEKDYLESLHQQRRFYGIVQNGYFIDIGIPEDYERAGKELSSPPLSLKDIDKSWTLFLDRDGVINRDKLGSYIFNPDEFVFLEGGPAIFKTLTEKFGHLIVVTNQRGIGRGLMTEKDLEDIHQKMTSAITEAGGRIDGIYYSPSMQNEDPLRKPNPGMAFRAKTDFPSIDLSKSVMVGNKLSDMQFGKNAGMYTVFMATTNPETPFPHPDIDLRFDGLDDFVKAL